MKREDSVFYWPHFKHDKKQNQATDQLSHSDKFSEILSKIIDSENKLLRAKQILDSAYEIKLCFYNQFLEGGSYV